MHRKDWQNHKHKALREKILQNARCVYTSIYLESSKPSSNIPLLVLRGAQQDTVNEHMGLHHSI
jgi:hypothetical protein